MKKLREVGVILCSLVGALLLSSLPSYAATNTSAQGNGLRISPVRTDLTINPGESRVITVYAKNITSSNENLQVVFNDFQAGTDESGTPALLLNNTSAPSHSLRKFMSASSDTISIAPNEQKALQVTVTIPSGTPGGGYFGAVRLLPAGTNSSDKQVNLSASVASLVLVTVPGTYKEQMSVVSMDIQQDGHQRSIFSSSKNLQAVVRFNNTGDVQEQPFGKVAVKKGSKVVYTTEINNSDPKANVLPNSIRRFSADLKNVGSFGKYTVEGNFGYGNKGQLLQATTTFYVIPVIDIIIAVLILLVVVLAVLLGLSRRRRGARRS